MLTDLSTRHEMVSDLFPSRGDDAQFRLSDSQIEFFHKQGYVAGVRVLSDAQVDALRTELAEIADPAHPGHGLFYEFNSNESIDPSRILFHALGHWRITPGFHDLLWHPAITTPAFQLLGGPVRFWHDQLFCKPAHHGGVVAWHQDYSYWTRTIPMAHLTCWIALDDSTQANGCLQYIPGSHRWDLLPITGLAGDMDAIRRVLTDEQWDDFKPVPIELSKGCASFHHPLMIHGSKENSTNSPRRAAVVNFFRDGVQSDADASLLDGVPVIAKGREMGGQFFPLLRASL